VPTLLSIPPNEGFRVWMYICLPSLHKRQRNFSLVILAIVYGASLLNQKADDGRGTDEAVEHMGDERLHQFLSC
jgi:hypothetical protein